MLLWSSVFGGEGSGNEDNFLNSGCCAGSRCQAGKVPPLSPATFCSVLSGTHCFSSHRVFDEQTAEKSDVFLGFVGSDSSGASLLASSAVSGMPLRERRGLGPNFAADRLAELDEPVSSERVHDQLLCDGFSGATASCCVPQCGQQEGAQIADVDGGMPVRSASPSLVGARDRHTDSYFVTPQARANSWSTLHTARINSGGHADSCWCTYNSCGGVRGGTKPRSMSTREQVWCPAVEKLASLQQAPGWLHVET